GIGEHIYDDHITLEWEDVYGAEYYQLTVGFDQSFTHIIRVPSVLETNSYSIPYLDEDTVYYWRVKSVNEGGESEWSPVYHFVTIESDVDTVPIVPQNSVRVYPNPFIENKISRSNALTIEYENSEPTNVSIKIYNIKGQLIKELYNGYTDAGLHNIQWNWESENNQQVVSGLYLLKYQSSNYQEIKKILYYR
ncbi:MAG: T9SS type A sorting domain-containing protein, partial [Candidatus Cloacimonas sp.]|nr:T9SS type A sorting domain-containing protein [Candidatus Cloacimonadota bacterium]